MASLPNLSASSCHAPPGMLPWLTMPPYVPAQGFFVKKDTLPEMAAHLGVEHQVCV